MPMTFHWSYSAYESYSTCPRRYYETRIAKTVSEPTNDQQLWGVEVHKALELAISEGRPLPETLTQFQGLLTKLCAFPGESHTEHPLAVTNQFTPTPFDAADVWCRGIVDLLLIQKDKAIAIDYKTGRRKVDSKQLQLMAALVFANFSDIEEVFTGFVWLKENGKLDRGLFNRRDKIGLWEYFKPTVDKMQYSFAHNLWPAHRNGLCKSWCPVVSCHYNGMK